MLRNSNACVNCNGHARLSRGIAETKHYWQVTVRAMLNRHLYLYRARDGYLRDRQLLAIVDGARRASRYRRPSGIT
jgi:hypothetical protein